MNRSLDRMLAPALFVAMAAAPLLGCYVESGTPGADTAYMNSPPPPPPPEVNPTPPPPPGPDYGWVPGYQRWNGHSYSWQGGHYERRPRPNAQYTAGHWEPRGHGQVWVEGRWQ